MDGVTELRPGVHLVHGTDVNWVVLTDGDAVTLVDTGYPGDRGRLVASLAAVGRRPEDLTAVLITHAHVDHLGSAEHLRTTYDVPVLAHRDEVPHARREFLHQARPGSRPAQRLAARRAPVGDARRPRRRHPRRPRGEPP